MTMENNSDDRGDRGDTIKAPSPSFRSVLPHEPLPDDHLGTIHLQGGFEPKRRAQRDSNENSTTSDEDRLKFYWEKEDLADALHQIFSGQQKCEECNLPHADAFHEVTILEDASTPPFTKVRLTYINPLAALQVFQAIRSQQISPHHLFHHHDSDWQFTSRPLQATLLTTRPMLPVDMAWNRSNPPKFRRLICRPGESTEFLQKERQSTRYVFVSGLIDRNNIHFDTALENSWWKDSRNVCEAIRTQANLYDTSGNGVEVYVSHKRNKSATHSCHIGMRSPQDAKALLLAWQGKVFQWKLDWDSATSCSTSLTIIQSETLFVDYAAITKRSNAKAVARETGETIIKGESSRSECTSTTTDVVVPGLLLVPDFVSLEEEEVLLAALTGPTAPWAPSQTNFSKRGTVKRRVQHYGYVFDYETANVKRDRSEPGSDCPPLPGLPDNLMGKEECSRETLEHYFQQCVVDGRGWDCLGCTVERTRQQEFLVQDGETKEEAIITLKTFPNLNQITVNVYEPGEGIGSHVDTPSAFDDGLISISLSGGAVMEFRKQNSDSKIKKLVYLPPRSLLLMSGPARYEWEHMIVTRRTDTHDGIVMPRKRRVSLTLRTAIGLAGDPLPVITTRSFPPVWGSSGKKQNGKDASTTSTSNDALVTPSMEREHVHAVYDAIATQWHHTRGKRGVLWPGATQFLKSLPQGSIVADVGCGDGKYFPAIWEAGSYVIGSDISLPLLQQAAYRGREEATPTEPESRRVSEHRNHLRKLPAVAVADCMNIPLRTKSMDAAICIAVMHHISTQERRSRCIAELARIVKVGGKINIQAWAMEQEEGSKRRFAGTDVFVPFNAQPKYLEKVDSRNESLLEVNLVAPGEDNSGETQGIGTQSSKSMAQLYSEEYKNAEYNEKNGLVVFKRYCHLYRKGELEELVSEIDAVELQESGYESGNHFVILQVIS